MLDNVTVRPAEKLDLSQLVDLINSQYSRKKDSLYFLWQYFDAYYPSVLMCAFSGSKLVGTFGLQKKKLVNGAGVGHATDLLVSSECRKQGIFKLLGEKAVSYFEDLDMICSMPNLNGKNACERAFGWRTLGKVNSMFLKNKSLNVISEELIRERESKGIVQVFNKFAYSADTRRWRYDQHPDYEYKYIELVTGEFVITKLFVDPDTGGCFGDIVDIECNLYDYKRLGELFLKADRYLENQGAECITTWALPGTPFKKLLELLGFVEVEQERYFCMKVLKKEYEHLYDLSGWHLVQADAEIY